MCWGLLLWSCWDAGFANLPVVEVTFNDVKLCTAVMGSEYCHDMLSLCLRRPFQCVCRVACWYVWSRAHYRQFKHRVLLTRDEYSGGSVVLLSSLGWNSWVWEPMTMCDSCVCIKGCPCNLLRPCGNFSWEYTTTNRMPPLLANTALTSRLTRPSETIYQYTSQCKPMPVDNSSDFGRRPNQTLSKI